MHRLMLVAMLLATGPAWAEWVKVGETEQSSYYVDPVTIRKDADTRQFWTLQDMKAPDKGGDLSYRVLVEADCKERRSRTLRADYFRRPMAEGERTGGTGKLDDWRYARSGTVGDAVMKFVCSR